MPASHAKNFLHELIKCTHLMQNSGNCKIQVINKDRPLIFCRESEEFEWVETKGDNGIRYIICRNPSVEVEQRAQREKNIALLEESLEELQTKVNAMKRPSIKNITKQVEEILKHKHGRRFIDYKIDEKTRKLSFWRKEGTLLFMLSQSWWMINGY